MTTHLSSQELVNALDQALAPSRQGHLAACASCQAQVAELGALVEGVNHDVAVPEPSPLFWDHFQARVLAAVAVEDDPAARDAWWKVWAHSRSANRATGSPRFAQLAASVTVLAVVTGLAVYMARPVAPGPEMMADEPGVVDVASLADAADDEWAFVTDVMGALEGDDIHEVLAPSRDAVDAAFEALTSEERDRFMKLLKAQMGEGMEQ